MTSPAVKAPQTLGELRDELLDKHRYISRTACERLLFQFEVEVRRVALEEAARIAGALLAKGGAK